MDAGLLPLGLALKLIAALALCFGALVGAAWALKRRWPGLARLGRGAGRGPGLEVLETKGLAPGVALHLIEVEGSRILVLQTKDKGEVVWTREGAAPGFEAELAGLSRARVPAAAAAGPVQAVEDPAAAALVAALRARAADAADAQPAAAAAAAPGAGAPERGHALELHRARQKRYRERRKSGGSSYSRSGGALGWGSASASARAPEPDPGRPRPAARRDRP